MEVINIKRYWPNKITYGNLLNEAAKKWYDLEALIFKEQRYSFADLKERVDELAKGLIHIGIRRGEKVSLWLNNCPEWVFFYIALAKIGAVVIPVNTRFKPKELAYVVGQSESSVLIIGQPYRSTNYYNILKDVVPEIEEAVPGQLSSKELQELKTVISVGETTYPGTFSYSEIIGRSNEVSNEVLHQRESEVDPDDLFNVIYTSGTTGFPKGVMHSHKIIANMRDVMDRMKMSEKDRILVYLPFFHVYATFAGMTGGLITGACIVLMEAFDAEESLMLIDSEKITVLYGFDTMYFDMMNHSDFNKYSKETLRFALLPATRQVAETIIKELCPILNITGMTEGSSTSAVSSFDDPHEKIVGSNGRPLPAFTVKIINPGTGETLPPNKVGELCLKGHPVMLGYYKKPEETEKVLDSEGWLRTGDSAYLDEEGYLHFVGRYKDMIKVGGENVDPVEIEELLSTHPAIYRASVVSAPHPRLAEVCFAFVQLRDGYEISEEEVIKFCKGKIAGFKVPRGVAVIDEFPITPTGKIQKYLLREQAKKIVECNAKNKI